MPEVTRWLTGQPASLAEYVERYGTPERLGTTLVVEAADVIVGDLFVSVETPYAQVEVRDRAEDTMAAIGWLVDPAYAGQGFATEAAAAPQALHFALFLRSFLIVLSRSVACLVTFDLGYFCLIRPR